MNLLFQRNYYPTRFSARPRVIAEPAWRNPRLTLPFLPRDFDGITFEP